MKCFRLSGCFQVFGMSQDVSVPYGMEFSDVLMTRK